MGHLTLNESFIDGTKMESRAYRYTFAWRKSVEKNRIKLDAKIRENRSKEELKAIKTPEEKYLADSGYGSEENYAFMQIHVL
jgi:hypothetical protein